MTRMRISPKHGLNPMIPLCYYCGKEKNELALLGRLKGDEKAPGKAAIDLIPCEDCMKAMEKGIMLIGVKDGSSKTEADNPERTGDILVIKEEAARMLFEGADFSKIRACFVEDSVLKSLKAHAAGRS